MQLTKSFPCQFFSDIRYGRLPWKDLVDLAASIAINGFRVTKILEVVVKVFWLCDS